jgi:pyruvate/2-oxoglutarate/acetoin dehydrogenase E1 component/TPP-dependent pyruvate/acetoin dehydrogenase alpha subunit
MANIYTIRNKLQEIKYTNLFPFLLTFAHHLISNSMIWEVSNTSLLDNKRISFDDFRKEVLNDFRIANESREASLLGRREVLTGKAKFGIFGDGKELPQIAMAKVFRNGDFRSGYYRDQTFMIAAGLLSVEQFFAQLYANPDLNAEPMTGGRQMNGHFATRWIDKNGNLIPLTSQKNSSCDISPTAGQMPRLLGLALASKYFRENKEVKDFTELSVNGNEVAFGTIGDASTSEGQFWETMNAAAVLQVPLVMSVWDDGYGISVPRKYQTAKGSISEALKGFQKDENGPGILIFKVKAWDYAALIDTYQKAVATARMEHIPVLIHVEECTQPQGHSTSGSHERYKTKERLEWEADFDCIKQLKKWILDHHIASVDELDEIEKEAKNSVAEAKRNAWNAFMQPIKTEITELQGILQNLAAASMSGSEIASMADALSKAVDPMRKEVLETARRAAWLSRNDQMSLRTNLLAWIDKNKALNAYRYNSMLYNESKHSALKIKEVKPEYKTEEWVDGRIILRDNYEYILEKNPLISVFGEDVGGIGGVNQTLEGMQKKFGESRVFDTGIREMTIIGQGIGMAMRGLRPIAEIQYLDYLLYALQTLSDDLATLHYRTMGGQSAPLIVSTRGHRLEGIWHSGSPMGMIVHALRGMYVCVPRNMTQAAGMYNTLLQGQDPALVIEPLNGYRIKEKRPSNIGKYNIPLGIPDILREGDDLTIVSYGSTLRQAEEACVKLAGIGISCELIDIQTLIPFDTHGIIAESISKTSRVLFLDEDVEGGATSYMMQEVLEKQDAFKYLDAAPRTLTAKNHRPAYGSDGDYFSKPSTEDIFEVIYSMMNEANPTKFPRIF